MKSSICWSATLAAVLAVISTTAFAQGVPGSPGPAPYGGPVRGMPGYGDAPIMPAGMYGASPGMPGGMGGPMPGGTRGGIPAGGGPGRISGYGPPPGMMGPGMFGPGMGGPGMGGPMGPGMPVSAQEPAPIDMGPPPELPEGATPWQNPFSAEDTACYDGSCGCCTQCCQPGWLWADLEFLLWWQKGSRFPSLVTTSDDVDAGVLGMPTTETLFGSDQFGDKMQTGGRVTLGFWADREQNTGIGTRFTALSGDSNAFTAASDGSTVLARPFYNALLAQEDALLIGYTDPITGPFSEGSINSRFENSFISSETFVRTMIERDRNRRIDLMLGYHFLRLDNYFRINSFSTSLDPITAGTTFSLFDRFNTENEFHGGMVGLEGSRRNGRWALDWGAKVSFGQMRQTSTIDGGLVVTPGGIPPGIDFPGGLFAQQTNMGTRTRYEEVFIPEFNLGLTYYARPNLSFGMSYNYMWISSVLLSGDQIDRQVNLTQQSGPLIGPARPAFAFNDTDYWLMGMNFTVQYNY